MVGFSVGSSLGSVLGFPEGSSLGSVLGLSEGSSLGSVLGFSEGSSLGLLLGYSVRGVKNSVGIGMSTQLHFFVWLLVIFFYREDGNIC